MTRSPVTRMETMTNWSGFDSGAGARVTTRNYNPYQGWLKDSSVVSGGPFWACGSYGLLELLDN